MISKQIWFWISGEPIVKILFNKSTTAITDFKKIYICCRSTKQASSSAQKPVSGLVSGDGEPPSQATSTQQGSAHLPEAIRQRPSY